MIGPRLTQYCVYCSRDMVCVPVVLIRDEWGEGEDYRAPQWAHVECYLRMFRIEREAEL